MIRLSDPGDPTDARPTMIPLNAAAAFVVQAAIVDVAIAAPDGNAGIFLMRDERPVGAFCIDSGRRPPCTVRA